MAFMKRIPTPKNGFWKKAAMNIPFVLLIALMIAFFGGGLLLMFYSIVSVIAFNSAMIYLIVAGAGAILVGLGLCLITAYQKYFVFYSKKMGRKYIADDKKREKTVTYTNKPAAATIKKYLTVTNVGLAILALGSIFAIISAALGSIDRANWVDAIGGFKDEHGYFADIQPAAASLSTDQKTINVSIRQPESNNRKKKVIVIYTKTKDRQHFVSAESYIRFHDDVKYSKTIDGTNDTLIVDIGEPPEVSDSLGKLLFFVFNDYNAERQIRVYIPYNLRDSENISVDCTADRYLVEESDGSLHEYTES